MEKNTPVKVDWNEVINGVAIDENRKKEIEDICKKIIANKMRYQLVSVGTGVPWKLIACLHYRESSLDFSGVLHNGERILGKGKKTSLVPKGRGPFNTWEESAHDALILKKNIFPSQWTFANCLEFAERFNGLGYRSKIGDSGKVELSPYVMAGTNKHDETSKYTHDGKYSPTAPEKQLGICALMITLDMMDKSDLFNED